MKLGAFDVTVSESVEHHRPLTILMTEEQGIEIRPLTRKAKSGYIKIRFAKLIIEMTEI